MGRNSSRSGEPQDAEAGSTADTTETTQVAPSMGPSESLLEQVGMSGASDSPGPDVRGQASPAQYEAYYGVEIDAPGEVDRLQRLEESNTLQQVREWADEGMPVAAMGEIPQMEAFRERKGTPVPWDVEQRNDESKRRNTSPVQRATHGLPAGGTDTPESVREVLSSPGQSLDASIQRTMEDRMGDSLGDVRIHTGPKAAKACEDIDAKAFTVGNHVAFNHGEYDPESPEGQHVLAHELAHVRQQTGGAVSMLPQDDVELEIDPDPALEREAEATAQHVMEGGALGIQRLGETEVHLQRSIRGAISSKVKNAAGLDDDEDLATYVRSVVQEEFAKAREGGEQAVAAGKQRASEAKQQAAEGWKDFDDRTGGMPNTLAKAVPGGVAGAGGKTAGAAIGGAAGTMLLPGVGTAVGSAVGASIGGTVAKDSTKQLADNALPEAHSEAVQDLYDKFQALEKQIEDIRKGSGSTGSGDRPGSVPATNEA